MKICLGILAYNEEDHIQETLEGLLRQDLWVDDNVEGSMFVVVNGSNDRTAERAREIFEAKKPKLKAKVFELKRPGKANAWNKFVHTLSPKDSDFLILADADILLPRTDALSQMVITLSKTHGAVACVDLPQKDFSRVRMSWLGRKLSGSASSLASSGPPKLCGQLYVAKTEAMREIFLPEPMLVEDGFIKAMLVTKNFKENEQITRLVRAEGVTHLYEPEVGFGCFIRHEKRIMIGSLCNFMLFGMAEEVAGRGEDVGEWLRKQQETDPDWFRKNLEDHFVDPANRRALWKLVMAPLQSLKHLQGVAKIKAAPVAFVRFLISVGVGAAAAGDLRKKRFVW